MYGQIVNLISKIYVSLYQNMSKTLQFENLHTENGEI